MKKIFNSIISFLKNRFGTVIIQVCSSVNNVFSYLSKIREDKANRERAEKIENANSKIEKACDGGNIGDLIDAVSIKKSITAIVLALILCGCTTITVQTVKNWEGRYDTKTEAANAAEAITLDDGESVWILSNRTLKRLLTTDTKD